MKITHEVLNEPGITFCFWQGDDESMAKMSRALLRPNTDYTALIMRRQQNAGHKIVELQDTSYGITSSETAGEAQSNGWSSNESVNNSENTRGLFTNGSGSQEGSNEGISKNNSTSQGRSLTVSNKKSLVPQYEMVVEESGRLTMDVGTQDKRGETLISLLPQRVCLVRVRSQKTKLMRVKDFIRGYEGRPRVREYKVRQLIEEIRSSREFYFTWTGKNEISSSENSSAIPQQETSGLKQEYSPIQNLLRDVQRSSKRKSEEE